MPVVFITGGARRIGKGLVLGFAKKGYAVGFTYNSSEADAESTRDEVRTLGVPCEIAQADVAQDQSLHQALQQLEDQLGVPDVVVSNAGVFPPQRSLLDLTPDDLRKTFDINTIPLLTIARYLSSTSDKQTTSDPKRLICISSIGGQEIWKQRIDYNTSKSAVITLVKALSREMAPAITVNSVAPGAIVIQDEPSETDNDVSSVSRIPMGRYGTEHDIFDAVWQLATGSSYITGQIITVDGGYHQVR